MKSRWTKEEELEFIRGIAEGKTMDDLSKVHDRTSTALELRLKKIIYENVSKGREPDSISKNLNLPKTKVLQYYFSYVDFREKNGKEVKRVDLNAATIKEQHGGKRKKKSKSKNKKKANKKKVARHKKQKGGNVNNKIKTLEEQNKLLETIIKNNQMKTHIKKLEKENKLDRKMKKIVKRLKDEGLI